METTVTCPPCQPQKEDAFFAAADADLGPPPLSPAGSPYWHQGICFGLKCPMCYKYECVKCGTRTNRVLADCYRCGFSSGVFCEGLSN